MSTPGFRIETIGIRETGEIKLTMGGKSHGTFKNVEELLRYAARVATGRVVLAPGTMPDRLALRATSANIRKQANKLRKDGFK